MGPDIADQFDSVSHFMAHLLMIQAEVEERDEVVNRGKRQVSVRIPMHVYEKLVELAGEVGEAPTTLAAAFLELAIYEAAGVTINPHNANSAEVASDG